MRVYGANWLKTSVAEKLDAASRVGTFNGIMNYANATYLESCKAFHAASGTLLIFTRDTGHHSSGWLKNPQYERCLHLSLSYREPFDYRRSRPTDPALSDEWVTLFFGGAKRFAWRESAKSQEGKALEVWHWRVFCDEFWQPFLPSGEVYSTELTERGWKSFSELYPTDGRKEPSTLYAG